LPEESQIFKLVLKNRVFYKKLKIVVGFEQYFYGQTVYRGMKADLNSQAGVIQIPIPEVELRKNRKRIFDFIRSRVSTNEDAEDLLQDVFYQFLVNFNAVEPLETATAWLITVARNKITDWYRKRRTFVRTDIFKENLDEQRESVIEAIYDPEANPEVLLERMEFWACLSDALDSLPAGQREVFIKHELEEYSFKEIAAETGLSIGTLVSRKHDAVVKLRTLLSPDYKTINI